MAVQTRRPTLDGASLLRSLKAKKIAGTILAVAPSSVVISVPASSADEARSALMNRKDIGWIETPTPADNGTAGMVVPAKTEVFSKQMVIAAMRRGKFEFSQVHRSGMVRGWSTSTSGFNTCDVWRVDNAVGIRHRFSSGTYRRGDVPAGVVEARNAELVRLATFLKAEGFEVASGVSEVGDTTGKAAYDLVVYGFVDPVSPKE